MDEKNCFSIRREEIIYPDKPITFKGYEGYETYKIDDFTIGVRPKWISIEDIKEKPENQECYIVTDGINVTTSYYDIAGFVGCEDGRVRKITHWMPLPKPPSIMEKDDD